MIERNDDGQTIFTDAEGDQLQVRPRLNGNGNVTILTRGKPHGGGATGVHLTHGEAHELMDAIAEILHPRHEH